MDATNWHKQDPAKPLFDDIVWLRPQNTKQMPKVVLIGGSNHGFAEVTKLYNKLHSNLSTHVKLILPSKLEKIISGFGISANYLPSTPAGEISDDGLNELLSYLTWADVVIFAGDLGNNSRTEILVNKSLGKFEGKKIICSGSVELVKRSAESLIADDSVIIVGELPEISKFNIFAKSSRAITSSLGLVDLVDVLSEISSNWKCGLVTFAQSSVVAAHNGQVSTTKHADDWLEEYVASLAVYLNIYDNKQFDVLSTACLNL